MVSQGVSKGGRQSFPRGFLREEDMVAPVADFKGGGRVPPHVDKKPEVSLNEYNALLTTVSESPPKSLLTCSLTRTLCRMLA